MESNWRVKSLEGIGIRIQLRPRGIGLCQVQQKMCESEYDHTPTARADPGFFVGSGRTPNMGAIWPPRSPYGPQFSRSTEHIGTLGPTDFCLHGPDFGPELALFMNKIRNFFITYQCFGPKNGAFSCRGGGQGPLAPAPVLHYFIYILLYIVPD